MTTPENRIVLLASESGPERDRLKKALEPVFTERNETPQYREIGDYRELLIELQSLEKNLVTLVVISGFKGRWHMLFGKFAALVETKIAGVFMSDNALTLQAGEKRGFRSVPSSQSEAGVTVAVREQLNKLAV
jgi:hypothetical protein